MLIEINDIDGKELMNQLREQGIKFKKVEWVEICDAEDVPNGLVGEDLILWDGCNYSIDHVDTEVDYGTSFFSNGTEATHYLRGITPPGNEDDL